MGAKSIGGAAEVEKSGHESERVLLQFETSFGGNLFYFFVKLNSLKCQLFKNTKKVENQK